MSHTHVSGQQSTWHLFLDAECHIAKNGQYVRGKLWHASATYAMRCSAESQATPAENQPSLKIDPCTLAGTCSSLIRLWPPQISSTTEVPSFPVLTTNARLPAAHTRVVDDIIIFIIAIPSDRGKVRPQVKAAASLPLAGLARSKEDTQPIVGTVLSIYTTPRQTGFPTG